MENKDYDKMLDQAYKEIKPIEGTERFEIPKARIIIQGTKTTILNFGQICSILRRQEKHLAKFLMKELAVSAVAKDHKLLLNRRISREKIDKKIEQYAHIYVICPECGKPDTELVKQDHFTFLHCLACGAKHSVPSI